MKNIISEIEAAQLMSDESYFQMIEWGVFELINH